MSRFYEINGKQYPSVTTILGKMLSKDMLVPWAAKMTAQAFKEILDRDHVCFDFYSVPQAKINAICDEAKKAYRVKSTEAMDKGTRVHNAIEEYLKSECMINVDSLQDEIARKGLKQFIQWGNEHDVQVVAFEQQIDNPAQYARRYDLLAYIDGKLTLLDFKTSTGIYEPEMPLQLHAYAGCCIEHVEQVAILRLDKETGEIEYKCWDYNPVMYECFCYMAMAYNILFPYKAPRAKKSE